MSTVALIETIQAAKAAGLSEIAGELRTKVCGVKRIRLTNLDGRKNGNTADVWIESESGAKVLGQIFTGSRRNRVADCRGWDELIDVASLERSIGDDVDC